MADNLEGVNFYGKRGVNAADPRNDKDVVNLRTLRNTISLSSGQTYVSLTSLGSGLSINNGITGLTYGIRTITGGTNTFINVLSDSTLLVDSLNYYTTGATLSGNIVFFDRNDTLSAYTLDLSTVISPEKYWTSGTTGLFSIRALNDSTIDATGNYSVAEGYNNITTGDYSHVEGSGNTVNGLASHAQGRGNFVPENFAHAQGSYNTSNGENSFVGGNNSSVNAPNSFVFGVLHSLYGLRSAILGGSGITGSSDDTVYVPYFNIQSADTASMSDYFLAIDSNGEVKKSSFNLFSGSTAATIALSGITGGVLGDTIRHNGTGWTANNFLYNNGTYIGINNTSPSALFHLSGIDSTSSNYSFKIDNSGSESIFSVRNDGALNLKNNGSIIFGTGSTPSITNSINNGGIQLLTLGSTSYRFGWNTGELWLSGNLGGFTASFILENTSAPSNGKNNILLTDSISLSANYAWSIGTRASGISDFGFKIENLKTGSTVPFYISNDVNNYIGIHNTTPTTQLDVSGKIKTTNLQITSGATTGYVLTAANSSGDAYWSPSSSGGGSTTFISNGLNTYTGGTSTNPTVNVSGGTFNDIIASGESIFNSLSATTLSASTIFSGSTDISYLFATPSQLTRVQNGLNTYTGGTESNPNVNISALTISTIIASGESIFNSISAVTISGNTIYSGSTNLSTLFITNLTGVVETIQNSSSFGSAGIAQIRAIATLRI